MKGCALLFGFCFLLAGVAWEGPACASIKGKPSCCKNCPFRTLPKVGNSCCSQGVEKGALGTALSSDAKKPVFVGTSLLTKNESEALYHLEISSSRSIQPLTVYLLEEHLLL